MEAIPYQLIDHAILNLVLEHHDRNGYPTELSLLGTTLRPTIPAIDNWHMVDALKRLQPRHLKLCKYREDRRCIEYPGEWSEEEFFYIKGFQLRRTEHSYPHRQKLLEELHAQEAKASMNTEMSEEKRKSRFDRWEKLGLDRVKSDLQTGGMRDIGGPPEVRESAWEWVRMKEEHARAAASLPAPTTSMLLIAEERLTELRQLRSATFDLKKLIRLCEEINIAYSQGCYLATAMLTRGLLDHVPPLFGQTSFKAVANNYGGAKSFKEIMDHLENASRKIADSHLHTQIRASETLPVAQQVNCAIHMDALLAEIVRITR